MAADKKEKRKDLPKLPVPPPQPVPQEIVVKRGDSIEIQLKIYGSKNENLKYLIRTPPSLGKLTEPRALSQAVSVVTYQSPANLDIKRERFAYAVQNINGVSAPSEVGITILDDAPQIIVPEALDFGSVLAGKVAMREIEIANAGGSISAGEVQVPTPFRVEGPAQYRLGAGARQKFLVFFEPHEPGTSRGEIRYTSQLDHATTLRAVSEAAIASQPAELSLQHPATSPQRAGRLELSNNTDEEQVLTLQAGPRLHVPGNLTIPAHDKMALDVSMEESDVAPLEDALLIAGAGIQVRVPIHAQAARAVLKLEQPILRFPTVIRSQPAALSFSIENIGGQEGFWKWKAQPPFAMEPESARLRPRERKEIRVSLTALEAGHLRGWLRFEGELQSQEAQVEAEVVSALPAAAAPAQPRRGAASSANLASAGDLREAAVAQATDARIAALVYLKENVNVTHIQPENATVEWPAALTSAKTCRVEIRTLRMDDTGKLREEWQVPANLKLNQNGGRYFAEIGFLRPGSLQTVRVVPVDEEGQPRAPLFQTQFQTLPPKDPPLRITGFRAAMSLLVALAVGSFAWQRIRRSREEAELNAAS